MVHLCDTGTTDNGMPYTSRIVTRPYITGGLLTKLGVMMGILMAKAVSGASVAINVIRDFGMESVPLSGSVSMAPIDVESQVIKLLDNLKMSEARTVQFELIDDKPATTGQWELNQLVLKQRPEQGS